MKKNHTEGMVKIPFRIAIVGTSAVGKTTFAQALSKKRGVPNVLIGTIPKEITSQGDCKGKGF